MEIEMDGMKLGDFVEILYQNNANAPKKLEIKAQNIISLLAIKNKKDSMLNAIFIPLDFEISEKMLLTLSIHAGTKKEIYQLGTAKLLNQNLRIGVVELGGFSLEKDRLVVKHRDRKLLIPAFLKKRRKMDILLNGRPILKAVSIEPAIDSIKFQPINYNFVVIRSRGDFLVDISKLNKSGTIYLSICTHGGEEFKIPFAQWIKTERMVAFLDKKDS